MRACPRSREVADSTIPSTIYTFDYLGAMVNLRQTISERFAFGASATNVFRPLSRGLSHMGSLSSALRPNSFTRGNRVAPLPPSGAGQAAVDAAAAAILAEVVASGRASASHTQCQPFQPAGAGGTQPGASSGGGNAQGLLIIEELDDNVQGAGTSLTSGQGGTTTVTSAEATRRVSEATHREFQALTPRNSSEVAQPQAQRTPL